ncbi:hypothetical protein CEUSTIGMA_g8964.t1 [Chlamydomonas eustigma]|uniref:Uncharacterized protein n=1 Tax=Chlamydomonas eustigma TaxID=1157962 RepID=A0A250XET2_9CHLO|nr:hypothetical protein CEUSTIGMA_g8964.t1 [Chlamydomonas eustigma]|eukprot:GAX81536.1 hypothetical protein CEUSTIGMA_g8964.t1 [Chlamydomonas eustigma]
MIPSLLGFEVSSRVQLGRCSLVIKSTEPRTKRAPAVKAHAFVGSASSIIHGDSLTLVEPSSSFKPVSSDLVNPTSNNDTIIALSDLELQLRHPEALSESRSPSTSASTTGFKAGSLPCEPCQHAHLKAGHLCPDCINENDNAHITTWWSPASVRSKYAQKRVRPTLISEPEGEVQTQVGGNDLQPSESEKLCPRSAGVGSSHDEMQRRMKPRQEKSTSSMHSHEGLETRHGHPSQQGAGNRNSVERTGNSAAKQGAGNRHSVERSAEKLAGHKYQPLDRKVGTHDAEARQLTAAIARAYTRGELAELLARHRESCNYIHIAAMIVRLVEVEGLQRPSTLAVLQHQAALQQRDSHLGSGSSGAVQCPSSSSVSTAPVGTETLIAGATIANHQLTDPSSTILNFSKMSSPTPNRLYTSVTTAINGSPTQRMLPSSPPASLQRVRHSMSRELMLDLAAEAERQLPNMGLREVSSVMSSLLKLRCPLDKPAVIRYMTRAFHVLKPVKTKRLKKLQMEPTQTVSAQSLVELIRAVAGFGMKGLRVDWADRYFSAVSARCEELSAQGIAVLLHSLAKLGHLPPPLLRDQLVERLVVLAERGRVTEKVGRGGREVAPSQLVTGANRSSSSSREGNPFLYFSPPDISMTLRALAVLRTQPALELCHRLLLASQHHLPQFTAQELANTVWGLGKLRMQLPAGAWCQDFIAAAELVVLSSTEPDELSSGGQALSLIMYSLGVLGVLPPASWLGKCQDYVLRYQQGFTTQGLSCVVYALGLMNYYPGTSWLQSFHSLVRERKNMSPASLAMLRKAYVMLQFHPDKPQVRPQLIPLQVTVDAGVSEHQERKIAPDLNGSFKQQEASALFSPPSLHSGGVNATSAIEELRMMFGDDIEDEEFMSEDMDFRLVGGQSGNLYFLDTDESKGQTVSLPIQELLTEMPRPSRFAAR